MPPILPRVIPIAYKSYSCRNVNYDSTKLKKSTSDRLKSDKAVIQHLSEFLCLARKCRTTRYE